MMKKLVLSAMFLVLLTSFAAAQSKPFKPFCGHCFSGWTAVKSNAVDGWKIGTVSVSEDGTSFVVNEKVGEKEVPCMVNALPGNWTQLNPRQGVDFYTDKKFGDCTVKLEFNITKGSNSGVYLMGEYEVQIADSFGKPDDKLGQGDMGAIYSAASPKINAATAPGTWQTYEIEFVAPKFDENGKKTANALFKKIVLNGKTVQENVEVQGPTGGQLSPNESPTGPLMLQGNHGPIAFRNIEIITP
ncbi:MAG: DUF1080 domain-containing protein [Planctomycetaceae bacterium]|jgi:hypothetical protein|nr:DUF1080 domain-containing protein [Planctomycetaceae bacterium]